jgi:tetratricopeptide (TPR) repeat protein
MAKPLDFSKPISRFKRLPRVDDVWQAAIVALPSWVDDEPGRDPYRPFVALCLSTTRHAVHFTDAQRDAPDEPAAATSATTRGSRTCTTLGRKPVLLPDTPISAIVVTIAEMGVSGKSTGFRPSVVQVRDPRVVADVAAALEGVDTTVELAGRLPALDSFLREMAAEAFGDDRPAALDAPGVTPDRLRAFADAAKRFHDAAPWRHLGDGDLIEVESPKAGKGLSLLGVMGSAGQEFGLSFFKSERQYRSIFEDATPEALFAGGVWGVWFNAGWDTAPGDVLAWDEHQLPLASPHAYPVAAFIDPSGATERADSRRLAYFEGLLRALAATSEQDMDAGRWSHTVETFDGPVVYTLALPDLLEPEVPPPPVRGVRGRRSMERATAEISRALSQMSFADMDDFNDAITSKFSGIPIDDIPSTAATPLERAQDLVYEAMEARGRRQLQLIRRALELSRDCADAYVLLAERASDSGEQQSYYEQAVAAGERALGPEAFSSPDRSFWGDVTTRPYMRARLGLADALAARGDLAAAVEHFQALLQLNPDDNQGARYRLLAVLLDANRDEEAETLLGGHDEDSALWCYAGVLVSLRKNDRRLARTRLRAALRANRHVPKYLTKQRALPEFLPEEYVWGSHEEAVLCALDLMDAWQSTPFATAWLKAEAKIRK